MEDIPELKAAVDEFRQKQLGRNMPDLKGRIWNQIQEKVNVSPAPGPHQDNGILSRHTKLERLRKEIGDLTVPENDENITMVPFRNVFGFEQFLVRVRQFVPEEIHEDLLESFYILEGTCTCFVGGEQFPLAAGGFLEIPMFIPHSVAITSEKPVLAILQRGIIY